MLDVPISKIICDTRKCDGGLYFYEEYFEWVPRSAKYNHLKFKVRYDEIKDVNIIPSRKKQIDVTTKDGKTYSLFTYNADHFQSVVATKLNQIEANGTVEEEPKQVEMKQDEKEDTFAALERLAALHEKNALTDEEFKAAKAKLLGL